MLIYGIATAMVTCVTETAVVRVRKEIAWSCEVERRNVDVCRRPRGSYDWFERMIIVPDRALGSGGARGVHSGRREVALPLRGPRQRAARQPPP